MMGLLPDSGREYADTVGGGHEPEAGIVLSEDEPSFGSACKHAIRLVRSFCDEIIDENADVGILSTEHKRLLTPHGKHGVDTCHDALRSSFFIARRTVDLSCEVKSAYSLRFKRVRQLPGVNAVIFNRVGVRKKLGMFKPRN